MIYEARIYRNNERVATKKIEALSWNQADFIARKGLPKNTETVHFDVEIVNG